MNRLLTRLQSLRHQPTLNVAWKIVIMVVGGTVLLVGIALIVLPGPAFLVIPLGLAILATEFVWAKRWLERAKGLLKRKRAAAQPAEASPVALDSTRGESASKKTP